jgi:hypothetical protein
VPKTDASSSWMDCSLVPEIRAMSRYRIAVANMAVGLEISNFEIRYRE